MYLHRNIKSNKVRFFFAFVARCSDCSKVDSSPNNQTSLTSGCAVETTCPFNSRYFSPYLQYQHFIFPYPCRKCTASTGESPNGKVLKDLYGEPCEDLEKESELIKFGQSTTKKPDIEFLFLYRETPIENVLLEKARRQSWRKNKN